MAIDSATFCQNDSNWDPTSTINWVLPKHCITKVSKGPLLKQWWWLSQCEPGCGQDLNCKKSCVFFLSPVFTILTSTFHLALSPFHTPPHATAAPSAQCDVGGLTCRRRILRVLKNSKGGWIFVEVLPGSLTFRPWKKAIPNRKVVFQPSFFTGYVKLWGCTLPECTPLLKIK